VRDRGDARDRLLAKLDRDNLLKNSWGFQATRREAPGPFGKAGKIRLNRLFFRLFPS
jgi:hypothetical protein